MPVCAHLRSCSEKKDENKPTKSPPLLLHDISRGNKVFIRALEMKRYLCVIMIQKILMELGG